MAPHRMRGSAWSLLLILLLSLACRRGPVAPSSHPRYWLHTVDAPGLVGGGDLLLVELLPEGRLRSVEPGRPFEGRLPPELATTPKWGRGLALYVQRAADLHYLRPDGPLVGRVLPGALVSLAGPLPRDSQAVGVALPAGGIGYVDAAALGVPALPETSWTPPPGARSALSPVQATVEDKDGGDSLYFASCEPVFIDGTRLATQHLGGFELRARVTSLPLPVAFSSTTCPATALTSNESGGWWVWSGTRRRAAPSSDRPPGFVRIDDAAGDVVSEALRRKGSFSWLREQGSGVACEAWRFHAQSDSTGELVRESDPRLSHPIAFRRAFPEHPATLFVGSLELDHHSFFKCDCSVEYSIVGAKDGEVAMLARPLPIQAIAYVPGEAERWFLSADACEKARKQTEETLARDPAKAASLGFHAYELAEP
ncbi:MAG: hypothetical protein IPJ34_10745 [Myxococcales bacterium]|nr:hypothetical protein [Myxococcales bacterium]